MVNVRSKDFLRVKATSQVTDEMREQMQAVILSAELELIPPAEKSDVAFELNDDQLNADSMVDAWVDALEPDLDTADLKKLGKKYLANAIEETS